MGNNKGRSIGKKTNRVRGIGMPMGKRRSGRPEPIPADATPEQRAAEFDRYDAELKANHRPQTLQEAVDASMKIRREMREK